MGKHYPVWISAVEQLGFTPVLVILESDNYLSVVERQVPDQCVIIVSPVWSALGVKVPHFKGARAAVFVDARITGLTPGNWEGGTSSCSEVLDYTHGKCPKTP